MIRAAAGGALLVLALSAQGLAASSRARYFALSSELDSQGHAKEPAPLPAWLVKKTEESLNNPVLPPSVFYATQGLTTELERQAQAEIKKDQRFLKGLPEEDDESGAEASAHHPESSESAAQKRASDEVNGLAGISQMPGFAMDHAKFVAKHLPPHLQHLANGLPQAGADQVPPDGPGIYYTSPANAAANARGLSLLPLIYPGELHPAFWDAVGESTTDKDRVAWQAKNAEEDKRRKLLESEPLTTEMV